MKTQSRSRRNTTAQNTPLPPQLVALLALIEEGVSGDDMTRMARALTTARASFRTLFQAEDCQSLSEAIAVFANQEAARGPWRELHQRIDALDRPEDSSLNATSGDIFNVYTEPAVAFALALAYVYLAEGGVR